jgi:ubiquinone/menaquinone biosynthesis C-methylase UbiE
MTDTGTVIPNHHGQDPHFTGLKEYLAGVTMIFGREGDARLAVRLSELKAEDAVVDVGCGPGAAVRHAATVASTVVGVDPAPEGLRVARLLTRNSERVRYLQGTAEKLPLGDASVSVLWSLATVHHWADLDAGLREARRVLKSGGRLVAIERRRRPEDTRGLASHGWTDEQAKVFADLWAAHGFVDTRVERHDGRRTTVSVTATAP